MTQPACRMGTLEVRGRWTWGWAALQPMPGQPTTARPLALDPVGSAPRPAGSGAGDGGEGPSAGEVGSFGPAGNWAAWLRLAARLVLGSSVEGEDRCLGVHAAAMTPYTWPMRSSA